MLIDESGSLSDAAVAAEIQAAGTIAQTQLNPNSRVTVIGFGGVNAVAPNQDPTNVVCQPTVASGVFNLNYLAGCVRKLHRRTEAEGDDTDYAAALAQAMFYLGADTAEGAKSPAGATKEIIMMTDGGLDVHRDPQYLPDWQLKAHHAVDLQLAAARAANVQIWPLGFGSISTQDGRYLNHLAQGGAQGGCVVKPHATVVYSTAQALSALDDVYAAASCNGVSKSPPVEISGGQTKTLQVTIPPIASAGAISVDKGNPNFRVSFLTPDGTTVTGGSLGKETFSHTGQDTAVDVLHVTNPEPGTWTIRVSAPQGLATELVSATAFWQGAVRVSILAAPSSARVGQPIKVTLFVLGPNGPITSLSVVKLLSVSVSVTGDGLTTPVNVPVNNADESNGSPNGVGDYNGTFTAPTTRGTLVFTGTVSGYGLSATQVPQEVQVGAPSAELQGTVIFSAPSNIERGSTVPGKILFRNQTGSSRRVVLTLSSDHGLATVESPGGTVTVPSGNTEQDFTLRILKNSPLGKTSVLVKAVDPTNLKIVYSNGRLVIKVLPQPDLLDRYHWEILAAFVLVLLALAWWAARNRIRAVASDVRGLYAVLRESDNTEINELKAPNRRSDVFRFAVKEVEGRNRVAPWRTGDAEYGARRDLKGLARTGTVTITTPDQEQLRVRVDGESDEIPGGMRIAIREPRKARPLSTGHERPAGPSEDGQASARTGWEVPHGHGSQGAESDRTIWG